MTGPASNQPYKSLEARLPGIDLYNVVIETPKGHRNKYKYEPEPGLFKLHKVLPAGAVFPYDFGFIPSTQGEDGDPLDVLLLMDEPSFTGCVLTARLIGVIEAEQAEKGRTVRNDRLVGVASVSQDYQNLKHLKDMDKHLLKEIEHFFVSYLEIEGKTFKPVGRFGPARAARLVEQGIQAFHENQKNA